MKRDVCGCVNQRRCRVVKYITSQIHGIDAEEEAHVILRHDIGRPVGLEAALSCAKFDDVEYVLVDDVVDMISMYNLPHHAYSSGSICLTGPTAHFVRLERY